MKSYNRHNFFKHTFCVFEEVKNLPFSQPDYISKKGSRYFFTDKGVFRESNHWGRAANCRWRFNSTKHSSQQISIGYARWEDFYPNNEQEAFFFIERILNGFQYNHKNHPGYDGRAVLRNAAATSKILKQLKEIQEIPSWFQYFDAPVGDLQNYFIDGLINTHKHLHQLKTEKQSILKKS